MSFLLFLFQAGAGPAPTRATGARPPRTTEIEPDDVTQADAAIIIRGLGSSFVQKIWAAFRMCDSRARILEQLNAGSLSDSECRKLLIAAEARNMRVSTLILIVLKSITFSSA
jgi:hypothetical protein